MLQGQKAIEAPQITPVAPPQTAALAATTCGIVIGNPSATYQALIEQRSVLAGQLSSLTDRRVSVARRLRGENNQLPAAGADKAGLEDRIANIDKQIASVEAQTATNNQLIACVAGIPGAAQRPPRPPPSGPPEEVIFGAMFFSFLLALPLIIAYSRRVWRRSAQIVPQIPRELNERLARIENTVESVAIELERVGEGQRFVTNLFIETGPPRALGAGAMEPIDVPQRERVSQERRDQ